MENELVVVARYPSSFEASLALRELEDAGISARLTNEATSEWMNYLGTRDVGVGLLTNAADAEKARTVLEQREEVEQIQDYGSELEEAGEERYAEEEQEAPQTPRDWANRALLASIAGFLIFLFSLYAIWLVLHHRLLSKQNMASIRIPLAALLIAVVSLILNAGVLIGQLFQ